MHKRLVGLVGTLPLKLQNLGLKVFTQQTIISKYAFQVSRCCMPKHWWSILVRSSGSRLGSHWTALDFFFIKSRRTTIKCTVVVRRPFRQMPRLCGWNAAGFRYAANDKQGHAVALIPILYFFALQIYFKVVLRNICIFSSHKFAIWERKWKIEPHCCCQSHWW